MLAQPVIRARLAPNFDRVFTKNIFFLNVSIRWLPCEKIDRAYKIRLSEMPKLKFWVCTPESSHKIFSESVEVTICASNFDRYIYLLKIMPSGEQEMERSTYILFVKQCGDMFKSVTTSKRWIKTLQECQLFFLNKNQNIKKPLFPLCYFLTH